jgi:hypothetical protein
LGAASALLLGWRGLPRRGPAVALALGAAGGTAAAWGLVPPDGLTIQAAAVREQCVPGGAARGRAWESVEGFLSVEARGHAAAGIAFAPRVRVAPAAADRAIAERLARESPVDITVAPEGWSVRMRLSRGERRLLRVSRSGPVAGRIRAGRLPEEGGGLRLVVDNGLETPLQDAAVVLQGVAHPVGTVGGEPVEVAAAPESGGWDAHAASRWPAEDPRRALARWWGRRLGEWPWVLGMAGPEAEPPTLLRGEAGADLVWGPVLIAARLTE